MSSRIIIAVFLSTVLSVIVWVIPLITLIILNNFYGSTGFFSIIPDQDVLLDLFKYFIIVGIIHGLLVGSIINLGDRGNLFKSGITGFLVCEVLIISAVIIYLIFFSSNSFSLNSLTKSDLMRIVFLFIYLSFILLIPSVIIGVGSGIISDYIFPGKPNKNIYL